ncbi:MAG: DUF192 domain-containing protein [Candidatus Micrarchaeota archaeon]|nr:DUF192 domain-containing protein [Candidatus Micrarchaeota archaeon]
MGKIEIFNLTKKTKLIAEGEICNDFLSRSTGLMFRKKPTNLFFVFDEIDYHPIHSFFVNFKFDAIYLDKNYIVVDYIFDLDKNNFFYPKIKNSYLLELVPTIRKKLKIEKGDKIKVLVRK